LAGRGRKNVFVILLFAFDGISVPVCGER
jgi:hypothetical protein